MLALCGRYDYLCPVELWEDAIDAVPTGRLVVFEDSGHNPQLEQQEEFDDELQAFLSEHASLAGPSRPGWLRVGGPFSVGRRR